MEEAAEEIEGAWHRKYEGAIDSAELLEVYESLPISDFLDQKAAERKVQERAAAEVKQKGKNEEKFTCLQKELGKSSTSSLILLPGCIPVVGLNPSGLRSEKLGAHRVR
jgi:hypothetical protein